MEFLSFLTIPIGCGFSINVTTINENTNDINILDGNFRYLSNMKNSTRHAAYTMNVYLIIYVDV